MDQGVAAAVSEAYRVFSRYSFGASGAADSLGPLEQRLLRMTPPNEIPPELLAAHAASLTVTIEGTTADDFRALLPRYFELLAVEGGPVVGWKENALRGLARAGYQRQWPAEEAEAIDRLLAAWLDATEARGAAEDATDIRRLLATVDGDAPALPLGRGDSAPASAQAGELHSAP